MVFCDLLDMNRQIQHFILITDECEGTNVEGNITNNFNNGAWNPNSLPGSVGQYWEALYEGISGQNISDA